MNRVAQHVVILDGGTTHDRETIGNKGASVARMLGLGLPVPPAFALPIDECRRYHANGGRLDDEVWQDVLAGLADLEERTARRLGDPDAPLLVSVRSGAAVSMPGMMDTILNLGMTEAVEAGLARLAGDADFARRTHVRFCHEFGHTVHGADLDPPADDAAASDVCAAVLEDTGATVPAEPLEQLRAAIHAVFESWSSRRAVAYRRHWGIPEDGGTAVIVQAMVFGNLGAGSGTGVLFTRDPLSGEPEPYGEWLPGGQGEDVVSGTHDCLPLSALRDGLGDAHAQLLEAGALLERENGDVQDVEFTVEGGRLFLLQTRAAKRSPAAALKTAVDLAREGAIDEATALARVTPEQLSSVLAPRLSDATVAGAEVLARGTPACPGVAGGLVVPDADAAEATRGETVLVRPTTSPEDVAGMIAARAVVTERGGSTSHAAVVSRALGRPSVVGVGEGVTAGWGDRQVTVDGRAGVVYAGRLATEDPDVADVAGLAELLAWVTERSPVTVVDEAAGVLDLDAAGVGLDTDARMDVDDLAGRLRGALAARGAVLATADGARAVLRSGVTTVVRAPGQHAAPLLLRIVQVLNDEEQR
ncbi:MAG TPA: pyruvate, phosphate dikinase [Baekduia sp.]|uniref:pyruvate, phosphate dikinase n=1 Tax=Baekduia sp. TaxID=2600305 RepID=UPI002CE99565|nr:pyruvate, phosphate dikinase [Baekduia sp.]HMJ33961.1 pyruvate, phosphate dikinase [Baekduia sp.]